MAIESRVLSALEPVHTNAYQLEVKKQRHFLSFFSSQPEQFLSDRFKGSHQLLFPKQSFPHILSSHTLSPAGSKQQLLSQTLNLIQPWLSLWPQRKICSASRSAASRPNTILFHRNLSSEQIASLVPLPSLVRAGLLIATLCWCVRGNSRRIGSMKCNCYLAGSGWGKEGQSIAQLQKKLTLLLECLPPDVPYRARDTATLPLGKQAEWLSVPRQQFCLGKPLTGSREPQARYSCKVCVCCSHRKSVWKGDFEGYAIHPAAPRQDQLYLHYCKAATLAQDSTQSYKMN